MIQSSKDGSNPFSLLKIYHISCNCRYIFELQNIVFTLGQKEYERYCLLEQKKTTVAINLLVCNGRKITFTNTVYAWLKEVTEIYKDLNKFNKKKENMKIKKNLMLHQTGKKTSLINQVGGGCFKKDQ